MQTVVVTYEVWAGVIKSPPRRRAVEILCPAKTWKEFVSPVILCDLPSQIYAAKSVSGSETSVKPRKKQMTALAHT